MSKIYRTQIGPYKISLYLGRTTKVQGVNSNLGDGNHAIFWEFDSIEPAPVIAALRSVQARFHLPAIHLARSHPGGGFHAYCFKRTPWVKTVHIVSGTNGIDPGYLSMCCIRLHWTLRVSDKGQGQPEFHSVLESKVSADCTLDDLESLVEYEVWKRK
jgi:hypothetical protein